MEIKAVKFTDGAYHNFPDSQKIDDGIYFIKAKVIQMVTV